MSIEYIEVRNSNTELIGIVDVAKSIIWRSAYYGVGDFEIYIKATAANFELLQEGNYITRPNNAEVGIIEAVNIINSIQDGRMLSASGRFAKSILDRRHIYKLNGNTNTATILRGNVEAAIRQVVSDNAIACAFDSKRNMPILQLGAVAGIASIIVDESGNAAQKQVSFDNLLKYTDSVLQEYELSSRIILDDDTAKLQYVIYKGIDRSIDSDNAPVIFSREFDNLTDSEYLIDTTTEKTAALIGGAGEGVERFYTVLETTASGLQRRETWVDCSSVSKTYKDESDTEREYTAAEYSGMLKAEGKQTLSAQKVTENFSGNIDITNGSYQYNRDFQLGDIVTVQDNEINKFMNVRIVEITEVQDENGYTCNAQYSA